MTENLQLALQLLLVGMVTVFFILTIVVSLGRLLIMLVNKYSHENVTKTVIQTTSGKQFSKKKLAVLGSVVELVTQGQGVIKSVKKI